MQAQAGQLCDSCPTCVGRGWKGSGRTLCAERAVRSCASRIVTLTKPTDLGGDGGSSSTCVACLTLASAKVSTAEGARACDKAP